MPFIVPIDDAKKLFTDYVFVNSLTASEQKCAFHVQKNGEDLCLKIISPTSEASRLEREVQALMKVNHPNVVEFFEYTFSVGKSGARHYVVERFIPGSDLKIGAAWTPKDSARFFALLADGLEELKKHGLVHRDLKPTNIRVHTNGHPVIIDLGLVRHLALPDLTKTGVGLGTPAYFAPEQWEGRKRDIDHRTDLFAFGIILYEALTGAHPFLRARMTLAELQQAACAGDDHLKASAFTNLPPPMQILLKKLLGRQVHERPNDAAQVATILRNFEKSA